MASLIGLTNGSAAMGQQEYYNQMLAQSQMHQLMYGQGAMQAAPIEPQPNLILLLLED